MKNITIKPTSVEFCPQQTQCDCAIFTLANAILAALSLNHHDTTWWTSERILLLRYFFFAAIWMDKLEHTLHGGPKMNEVFHCQSHYLSEHVNVKNAVDFTEDLLRTDTPPPPNIEGTSNNAKRKSTSLQPEPMPKKRIFSKMTNAFAEWLRSAARKSISSNFQRNNFKAAI